MSEPNEIEAPEVAELHPGFAIVGVTPNQRWAIVFFACPPEPTDTEVAAVRLSAENLATLFRAGAERAGVGTGFGYEVVNAAGLMWELPKLPLPKLSGEGG